MAENTTKEASASIPSELEKKIEDVNNYINTTRQEADNLDKQNQDIKDEIDKSEIKNNALLIEIKESEKSIEELDDKILSLKEEISSLDDDCAVADKQLQDKLSLVEEYNQREKLLVLTEKELEEEKKVLHKKENLLDENIEKVKKVLEILGN